MRLPRLASIVAGAACGGLLLGAVGSATHRELVGTCMAVVGGGLWSGKVSVMTVGGILDLVCCAGFAEGFFPPIAADAA